MKAKHEPSGNTPEPASRKATVQEAEEKSDKREDNLSEIDIMNQKLEDIHQEANTAKVMASYLLAQHAKASRDSEEGDGHRGLDLVSGRRR